MVDSTTCIEIATKGVSLFSFAIAILIATWTTCKIKDLIFGDEWYGKYKTNKTRILYA